MWLKNLYTLFRLCQWTENIYTPVSHKKWTRSSKQIKFLWRLSTVSPVFSQWEVLTLSYTSGFLSRNDSVFVCVFPTHTVHRIQKSGKPKNEMIVFPLLASSTHSLMYFFRKKAQILRMNRLPVNSEKFTSDCETVGTETKLSQQIVTQLLLKLFWGCAFEAFWSAGGGGSTSDKPWGQELEGVEVSPSTFVLVGVGTRQVYQNTKQPRLAWDLFCLNYWLRFFFCLAPWFLSKESRMHLACFNNLHGQK